MKPLARRRLLWLAHVCALLLACGLCGVRSQTAAPRRITNTTAETLNLNPSLSGDGRSLAFETTASAADNLPGGFRLIRTDLARDPVAPHQLAAARAPAPALSQDGTRLVFSSKDDPLGRNRDANPELFFFDGTTLSQLTDTVARDSAHRHSDGCFQPSISDDGRLVAFSSNRDLAGRNPDGNSELFLFDTDTRRFTQLTDTTGVVGASDAKLSGDASRVAYLFDRSAQGAEPTDARDVSLFDRRTNSTRVVAAQVEGAAFAYGRAISDDGARLVYSAQTARNTTQVFLYDGRNNLLRQLTSLGARATDVPLHPTLSGDGSRVAFATRRRVNNATNADASVELYLYDIPTAAVTRITDAPAAATAEVVSSLNDDGSLLAFSFPRVLTDASVPEVFANNPEIYLAPLAPRAPFSTDLRIVNAASLQPSVAPGAITIARGSLLALSATHAAPPFNTNVGGTSLTVNGRAARLFYVSLTQINFQVPPDTEPGAAQFVVRNPDGFEIRGEAHVALHAPGLFTERADGHGHIIALAAQTLGRAPFDALDAEGDPTRLLLFCTGIGHPPDVSVEIDGRPARVEAVSHLPDLPGLVQINVALSSRLKGAGVVSVVVRAGAAVSNQATLALTDGGGRPRPVRIEIAPGSATIPVGGTMRFRATVRDAADEIIEDAAVVFTADDESVAHVDSSGVAAALRDGVTSITAVAGQVSVKAQLKVVERTLVFNEVLADPPDGVNGDANRDGTRSGADDEFVELVNATDAPLDVSGWTLKTRALSGASETTRHTFAARTSIPPGDALVLFGGGGANFDAAHAAFGGAQVFTASSGGLSLTNAGLSLLVRDAEGNLVAQLSYGTPSDNLGGDSLNQSLTRSPDITGQLVRHTDAAPSRRFSPGVKLDGTFFAPRTGRLTRVEIEPLTATVFAGETMRLTARAFDHFGRPMTGIEINFASSAPEVAHVSGVVREASTGFVTATLSAQTPGATLVTATANSGAASVSSSAARLEVKQPPPRVARVEISPASALVGIGASRQFTARAFDGAGAEIKDAVFEWSSSDEAVATVDAGGAARALKDGVCAIAASAGGVRSEAARLVVARKAAPDELIINEIFANPGAGGDANRDATPGSASDQRDEFVELFNATHLPLDLSGLNLYDSTSTRRHTFPHGTILMPGAPLVLFGGETGTAARSNIPGIPAGIDSRANVLPNASFGGALVQVASTYALTNGVSSALGLNNTGTTTSAADCVRIVDGTITASGIVGRLIAQVCYFNTNQATIADKSLTRGDGEAGGNRDLFSNGAGNHLHTRIDNSASAFDGKFFSPGLRRDGNPFVFVWEVVSSVESAARPP
ncbi:MAG TPA: lamin tail domain-containing protein [Pyrinomonadaceae bacterium]|nr:lamin tail domain-containing protein [Pyrinomonadaceae bacterium]